ncbi:MAG: hypothetical protein ACQ9IQ_15740, partial [Nitrospirales bacterium]
MDSGLRDMALADSPVSDRCGGQVTDRGAICPLLSAGRHSMGRFDEAFGLGRGGRADSGRCRGARSQSISGADMADDLSRVQSGVFRSRE